jgi:cytochrome c
VHLTGPSLANIWDHKAGKVEGFSRYSEAMKRASIVWNEATLDKWLQNPDALLPGTSMTFQGIDDGAVRHDVIAYLKFVSEGRAPAAATQRGGGMMGQPTKVDLKQAPPQGQVTALSHCSDTYVVKTADGKVNRVWEFNLRLKTDASPLGPRRGKPVIVGAGMQGDRASVVFSSPGEISSFIKESCE